MAKDVVIHVWCDRHMETDQRVEGVEHAVTLNGKARTIDLCEPCTKEFVTQLAELLDAHGAPALGTKPLKARLGAPRRLGDGTGVKCLWCDRDFSITSSSAYMRHIKVTHGYATAVEAFGTTCPVCGKPDTRLMMSHIKAAHPEYGFSQTPQVVDWARNHGDPHGVYQQALTRKPSLNPEKVRQAERDKANRTNRRT